MKIKKLLAFFVAVALFGSLAAMSADIMIYLDCEDAWPWDGWNTYGLQFSGQTIEKSSKDKYKGDYSLHLKDENALVGYSQLNKTIPLSDLNRQSTLLFSFAAKRVSGSGHAILRFLNDSNTLEGMPNRIYVTEDYWKVYLKTLGPAGSGSDITFPPQATQIQIVFYPAETGEGQTGEMYVDDIVLISDTENPHFSVNSKITLDFATETSLAVSWTEADDDFKISHYIVTIDEQSTAVLGSSYVFSGLSPNTAYEIEVAAVDYAGNISDNTLALTAKTVDPLAKEKMILALNDENIEFEAFCDLFKETNTEARSTLVLLDMNFLTFDDLSPAKQEMVCRELFNLRPFNIDSIKSAFESSVIITQINTCSEAEFSSLLIQYAEKISLPLTDSYYLKVKSINKEELIYNDIAAHRPFSDLEMIPKLFEKSLALVIVNNSEFGEIDNILKKYYSYFQIDLSQYNTLKDGTSIKADLLKSLAYKNFASHAKVKEAFESALKIALKPTKQASDTKSGKNTGSFGTVFSVSPSPSLEGQEKPEDEVGVDDAKTFEPKEQMFKDVPKDFWGHEYIEKLTGLGIISGYPNGEFRPNNAVTREEFVKQIVCALSLPYMESDFTDVDNGAWYYDYIGAASHLGIIKGVDNNRFGVGEPISRQDASVIIYRALINQGVLVELKEDISFSDKNLISPYAEHSISTLIKHGIIENHDGEFHPLNAANRAEAAKLVFTMLDIVRGRLN
ncbi:MAG: S-layer homology domain-containing protein [Firmicutes bacterium]|nr:S-layer homology domain-containing protein [Bacillota bacterium]